MNSTDLNESFSISLLINILTFLSSSIGIILSITFIFIILCNRSLHTLSNILTLNSTVALLILSSDTLSIGIYVLYRDIKRQQLQIPIEMKSIFLCHVRGYIAHMSFGALIYSYVIQASFRLIGTIFYRKTTYNQFKIYACAICIQWIFAFLQLLPIMLGNNQIYIEHEYLCQIAIENSKAICYIDFTNYILPVIIIMIIYYKITKSVREKENNGTYKYNIHRVRRQMVLTQRILILIAIIFVLGGPYTLFIILEALSIKRAPSYSHRIGFMFISIACSLNILTIMYYAQPIREMINNTGFMKNRSSIKYELQPLTANKNQKLIPKRDVLNTTSET